MQRKKIFLVVLSIFIVLIVGVGSYKYYTYIKNQTLIQTKQQAISDFNNNNLDEAIGKAQDLSKVDSTKIDGLLLLATAYAQKGSLEFKEKEYGDKAIQVAQQVLSIDSNNAEAYRIIGYAYEIEQNYPEALNNYAKSISINSTNSLTLASRGHAYYLMGDYKKATDDFNAALVIDPNMDDVLLNLARISYNMEDNKKAEEYLSKISNSSPSVSTKADAYILHALIKESEFDIDGALVYFNKALDLDQNSPYVITNVAAMKMILLLGGGKTINGNDINKLMADVERAITINPNQTIAYTTLGKMKVFVGDANGAMEQFKKAKEVLPNDITLSAEQKKNVSDDIDGLLATKITKTK